MIRRAAGGMASQGLSAASNFLLVVAVARSSSVAEFGAFAVVYSLTLLVAEVVRGYVGETLAVTPSLLGDRRSLGAAVGAGVSLGGVAAGLMVITSVALGSPLGGWLLVLAPGVVAVVWQGAVRSVAFATHRPSLAAASDATWLAVQLLGWSLLHSAGHATAARIAIVWWLSAAAGAAVMIASVAAPALKCGVHWLIANRRSGVAFGFEHLLQAGAGQGTVYAVGVAAGLPAAGALRAAQSLFGPLRAVIVGVGAVATPEAVARLLSGGTGPLRRLSMNVVVGLTGVWLAAVALIAVTESWAGPALLGETWPLARQVVPAVALGTLGSVLKVGVRLTLRARQMVKASVQLRTVSAILMLGSGIAGALAGGLIWAAYALSFAEILSAILGLALLRHVGALDDR